MKSLKATFYLIFLLIPFCGYSGYVITAEEGDQYEKIKTITYLDDYLFRFNEEDSEDVILHLKNETITMINNETQTYTEMNVSDFTSGFEKMQQQLFEQMAQNMTEAQIALYKQMKDKMKAEMNKPYTATVKIENIGSKKIVGYSCKGYKVFENDILMEELWLTDEIRVDGDEKLAKLFSTIDPIKSLKNCDKYINLIAGKTVLYSNDLDEETITEVKEIQKETIKPELFKPNNNYREVPMLEFFQDE